MGHILGYSFKCWITSAVVGVFTFIAYKVISEMGLKVVDLMEYLFWGIGLSIVGSIPLFILFSIINLILYKFISDPIRFRIIISILSIITWLIASVIVFGIGFYKKSSLEGWFFSVYLFGLVAGI